MSNNNDLIDRLETQSARLKAHEEVERLKFQLKAERNAHAHVRQGLEDMRDRLREERLEGMEAERRKERELTALRESHNTMVDQLGDAILQASNASAALAAVCGSGVTLTHLAAFGLTQLWDQFAFALVFSAMVGAAVAPLVRTRVMNRLWQEV